MGFYLPDTNQIRIRISYRAYETILQDISEFQNIPQKEQVSSFLNRMLKHFWTEAESTIAEKKPEICQKYLAWLADSGQAGETALHLTEQELKARRERIRQLYSQPKKASGQNFKLIMTKSTREILEKSQEAELYQDNIADYLAALIQEYTVQPREEREKNFLQRDLSENQSLYERTASGRNHRPEQELSDKAVSDCNKRFPAVLLYYQLCKAERQRPVFGRKAVFVPAAKNSECRRKRRNSVYIHKLSEIETEIFAKNACKNHLFGRRRRKNHCPPDKSRILSVSACDSFRKTGLSGKDILIRRRRSADFLLHKSADLPVFHPVRQRCGNHGTGRPPGAFCRHLSDRCRILSVTQIIQPLYVYCVLCITHYTIHNTHIYRQRSGKIPYSIAKTCKICYHKHNEISAAAAG